MASIAERLAEAGVAEISEPNAAFEALRRAEGSNATLFDRRAVEALALGVDVLDPDARRRADEHFYSLQWDGFEIVGSGRNDELSVADYDPSWPDLYEVWRERVANALGSAARRIEHVGSTAVPDLAAKPVVDIQVSVDDIANETAYVSAMENIGLQLRSRDAEHRYFRPFPDRPRQVHVHVCEVDGEWEREHLAFRDALRADARLRDEYGALKRRLAVEFADDRIGYTERKSAFINGVLQGD